MGRLGHYWTRVRFLGVGSRGSSRVRWCRSACADLRNCLLVLDDEHTTNMLYGLPLVDSGLPGGCTPTHGNSSSSTHAPHQRTATAHQSLNHTPMTTLSKQTTLRPSRLQLRKALPEPQPIGVHPAALVKRPPDPGSLPRPLSSHCDWPD